MSVSAVPAARRLPIIRLALTELRLFTRERAVAAYLVVFALAAARLFRWK